jgi:hypothetical protein
MIKTYYIKGESKKEVNERIKAGAPVSAVNYTLGQETTVDVRALNDGDVVKIWRKMVGSSPLAKAYGNWSTKKGYLT